MIQRASLFLSLLALSCTGKKEESSTTSTATPISSAVPLTDAPPSPFSVVVESRSPLTFAGLGGGVWVSDAARRVHATARGGDDSVAAPMPEGLPGGPGAILRVAGRLPNPIWVSFETLKDDGKLDKNPLFRLKKDSFSVIADDWKPFLVPWTKNRLLAASTSSLKLKIKVVEPSFPKPPDDLPSTRLDDASCAKTLQIRQLSALPTGEVFVAGTCRPGSAKAEARYVVIRWLPMGTAPAASASAAPSAVPAPSSSAAPAPSSSVAPVLSSSAAAPPSDAGPPDTDGGAAAEPSAEDEPVRVPGIIDRIPGVAGSASHKGLHAFAPDDIYTVAVEAEGKPLLAARLLHFDGTAWSPVELPAAVKAVKGLSGSGDAVLWLISDQEIWKKPRSGAWESVPPPGRAFPEPNPVWELSEVWGAGPGDVWVVGRHSSSTGKRELVLRLKAPKAVLRWE